MTAPKFAILVLTGEQWNEAMAKVSDLVAAVQALGAAVNDATAILSAPATPPPDDPAVQQLLDQVNGITSALSGAVANFKAAHPPA